MLKIDYFRLILSPHLDLKIKDFFRTLLVSIWIEILTIWKLWWSDHSIFSKYVRSICTHKCIFTQKISIKFIQWINLIKTFWIFFLSLKSWERGVGGWSVDCKDYQITTKSHTYIHTHKEKDRPVFTAKY